MTVQPSLWIEPFGSIPRYAQLDDYAALTILVLGALAYSTKGLLWSKPDPYAYKLYERPQTRSPGETSTTESRDIATRLAEGTSDIAVIWGSQSGTAERFAGRLAKDLTKCFGVGTAVIDASDIDPTSFAKCPPEKLIIFLASTFGEGDPSDNMHELWSWLRQETSLSDMRYLAFGLGNSKYKFYNHVVDVITERLDLRGAKSLLPAGRADDANGETEEHFLEWKEKLFCFMEHGLGFKRRPYRYEPSIKVVEDGSLQDSELHCGIPTKRSPRHQAPLSRVYSLPIVESRELFPVATGRNCLHVEVDMSGPQELKYKTGDHLVLWPINPVNEVERLIRVLNLQERRTRPIRIESLDGHALKVPSPTTVDTLLAHYLDITGPVSRQHIATLATFAATPRARDELKRISQDKTAFQELASSAYINLGRLLERVCDTAGSWDALPLSLVLEMLPPLQPRYYSISSSSVVQPKKAAITAVVSNGGSQDNPIPGLATNYLLALHGPHPHGMSYYSWAPHDGLPSPRYLHVQLRKSAFRLPIASSTPIIMVGAGTGVAPFRAFVQERARLKSMGRDVGRSVLFFGCRHPEEDYIYRPEFEELAQSLGDVFTMHTAFSRPTDRARRRYVQHKMLDEQAEVAHLLVDRSAYFYICGSAAMARDVARAVESMLCATQGWSEDEVEDFAARQRRQKRWLQDVWG